MPVIDFDNMENKISTNNGAFIYGHIPAAKYIMF